ncbi:pyridoxal phosphate-dependent aminotransferase family protein [Nocardia sp. 2]|uniref:8-amino-7-oxononanoate synthase n=1 Tax=Nocardia acididurans TaxID=2802282 RepID=A0ABS1M1E1_9NOCA|nr:pyridoxal phosphate-dependent aminotransferase family protein [Nocardia acididurans]MBL1074166.1 pyridoxal phosphate-dependent aminotransferase family protein [Nocardia acididurans]
MTTNQLWDRMRTPAAVRNLRELQEAGLAPYFRVMQSATTAWVQVDGQRRIMLGSNNYLGLANHPRVLEAASAAMDRFGAASTGSRVANGTYDLHVELEQELADWHGTDAAIVATTGYQINVGTVDAVLGRGDVAVLDHAAHASLQDGARMSGAAVHRFAHNDIRRLHAALAEVDADRTLVVVDGLYSMEGDIAPLHEVVTACDEFGALLMVDEAHSVGIYGRNRTGAAEHYGVADAVDIRMGTLSKGIGSVGGYVVGPRDLTDFLRTHARGYMFTTSGVPASVAAALAAIRVIRSDEGAERARQLRTNAEYLREALLAHGLPVGGATADPTGEALIGPIISVHIGDETRLVRIWNELYARGVFCGVGVYPGVARGAAILRVCVTADHTLADMETAAGAIAAACAAVQVAPAV